MPGLCPPLPTGDPNHTYQGYFQVEKTMQVFD